MPAKKRPTGSLVKELRDFGMRYPGAHLKSSWPGRLELAVKDKTFAYLSAEGAPFSISCKLPESHTAAVLLPFAEPTGWGLGKSGWVTAQFAPGKVLPLELLKAWIDESYRAQAPKKLSALLLAHGQRTTPRSRPPKKAEPAQRSAKTVVKTPRTKPAKPTANKRARRNQPTKR